VRVELAGLFSANKIEMSGLEAALDIHRTSTTAAEQWRGFGWSANSAGKYRSRELR
jgi:hypothetical protein